MGGQITVKTTTLMPDQNEILSSIEKITPKDGDVLLFYIKTDNNGIPLIDIETAQQTADLIGDMFVDKNVRALFLMDKCCLFSVSDSERAIKRLEKAISAIRETDKQLMYIESGNSEKSFVTVDLAEDPSKRV